MYPLKRSLSGVVGWEKVLLRPEEIQLQWTADLNVKWWHQDGREYWRAVSVMAFPLAKTKGRTQCPCKRWGSCMCLHFLLLKGPEFNQSWGNHQGDLIRPYTSEEAHFLAFLSEKYRSTYSRPSFHFLRIRICWDMVRIWWSSTGNTGKGLLWTVWDFVLGSHSDWLKVMVSK